MDTYHLALGAFIEAFAVAELWVLRALWATAGVEENIGQAALSGMRSRGAIDLIKRLFETRDKNLPADLELSFNQMNAINSMRDNVVHWGTSYSGQSLFEAQLVVSNEYLAHSPKRKQTYPISAKILDEMREDLDTIIAVLRHYTISSWPDSSIKEELLSRDASLVLRPLLLVQWKYKSTQPLSKKEKGQKGPRAPKGKRQPSQG
jgi:hypothetical protein